MSKELYRRLRPKKLDDIFGQDAAVTRLQGLIDKGLPHALLFTGPSGTGKTTMVRILQRVLEVDEADFDEIDCAAVDKPLDKVREIKRNMRLMPLNSACKVYFFEEAQAWSKSGGAQQALLKMLEDAPEKVYFFIATTDDTKLIPAIKTRTTGIALKALSVKVLVDLLIDCVEREGMKVKKDVLEAIAEASNGSARAALVTLEAVGWLPEKEQMAGIESATGDKDNAILLARALINPKVSWKEVASILKELTDEPEAIRYCVLAYCRNVLLNSGSSQAFKVIDIFSKPFYDSKQAGLAAACYEATQL